MTDPNVLTCHRCDTTKQGQWWHLNGYRDMFTGLVCSDCMHWAAQLTDDQLTAIKVAEALALKNSEGVRPNALKSKF